MNTSRIDTTKVAMIMGVSALVILLAGCQSAATAPPVSYTSSPVPAQTKKNPAPDSPQKTYSEQADNELQTDVPSSNRVDTTSDTSAETSTIHKTGDTKATVKTQNEDAFWSADSPKLQGIAIGDSDMTVNQLYGKPADSYTLDDENESIKVLEYDGFAVGINDHKKVQYIEVYGKSISAGLSGLRVGDDPEAALRALGKPGKQTAYLLIYEAEGALLKLDLDPAHNEIVSIKLLSLS
jgi:hypothetical protein